MRRCAEKVAGKSSHVSGGVVSRGLLFVLLVNGVDVVLTIVFGAAANALEDIETGRRGGVGVDIDDLAAFDVLEKSHSSVARIVLHHVSVALALAHIVGGVLEDAALAVSALRRVVKEVLAYRCQILPAEALFLLKLILAVGEATALFLLAVLAGLTIKPESA